ncbi:MAG: endonuclease/exonuclease/phosphatase family protein [Jatrophihabitans sp.]|uniref:endonuclease/exonuclease/phosphatase family protein n=1 Tax=Jatrophihabitans sp. TaxID=1932789 RepID=UPI003F7D7BE2
MRLVTFNLLHGRSLDDGEVDLDRLARDIEQLDPDILALQEVDRDQPRSHLADLTQVAATAMGAVSHRFVAALAGTPGATWIAATGREQPGTASYGIALLSRYPAEHWQTVRLPKLPARTPVYLPEPGKFLLLKEEPRAAVIASLRTPLGPVTVVNTHLSFVPGWNYLQLRQLTRSLAPFAEPVVLTGDLNMTGAMPERISGYRAVAHAPTFPRKRPTRQLDHVLVRGTLPPVTRVEALSMRVSDHCALVTEFGHGVT